MGTPDPVEWPAVKDLPEWDPEFPQFEYRDVTEFVPGLDEEGYDLLRHMLQFDPTKRWSAEQCMEHTYFDEVRDRTTA